MSELTQPLGFKSMEKCIKRELNSRLVECTNGNDQGYHYPIDALKAVPSMFYIRTFEVVLHQNG